MLKGRRTRIARRRSFVDSPRARRAHWAETSYPRRKGYRVGGQKVKRKTAFTIRRKSMENRAGVFQGLDTVLLRVRNLDLAKRWYMDKLGWAEPYVDEVARLAVFDLGGTTSLTLWELKPGEQFSASEQAATFPIFSVADARKTLSLLRERGVGVGALVESEGVTYFAFQDLDGNLLEACQVH